jgi:hypothetical protein
MKFPKSNGVAPGKYLLTTKTPAQTSEKKTVITGNRRVSASIPTGM